MNLPTESVPSTLTRRRFLAASSGAAGGLVLGFHVPFLADASAQAMAAPGSAPAASAPKAAVATAPGEMNCWVVIKPDDTVVIRVARSEMGQGTLTGLA